MGSNNGPAFIAKTSQFIAKALDMDWKVHCAYRPQSSGQVRRINRTLKETIKILIRVQRRMGRPPAFALLCAYCTSYRKDFPPVRLCLQDLSHCFPGWDQQLTELSNHSFVKSPQTPSPPYRLFIGLSERFSWPLSSPQFPHVWVHWYSLDQDSSQSCTETNLGRSL